MVWILQLIVVFGDGSRLTRDLTTEYETPGACATAQQTVAEWLSALPAPSSSHSRSPDATVTGITVQCLAWQKVGV